MLIACDVDGTADAYPREMQSILQAFRAAGHTVYIVTGVTADAPGEQDAAEKAQYLASLGLGQCYDRLVVIAAPDGVVADRKARYLASIGADLVLDNNVHNARAAAGQGILALVPWNSKEG